MAATRVAATLVALAMSACAATTVRSDAAVVDAGVQDGSLQDSGVLSGTCPGVIPSGQTCLGDCPHANGASCTGDCDCCHKCLGGVCAFAPTPTLPCGDAAVCPTEQSCGPWGFCEGAPCATSDTCPAQEQCEGGRCMFFGCI